MIKSSCVTDSDEARQDVNPVIITLIPTQHQPQKSLLLQYVFQEVQHVDPCDIVLLVFLWSIHGVQNTPLQRRIVHIAVRYLNDFLYKGIQNVLQGIR